METTFISIHNLSPDANILFASESIIDILGYRPCEVVGSSCFDYFHDEDIPFARYQHCRSVNLDKAAVLYYARIKSRYNSWTSCECVFTVVHDVLVACTSIYKGDTRSTEKVVEARRIRRIFSSMPRDPRYHMLSYLASKFTVAPPPAIGEPRAALILNRFSRTLSIMYSTNSVADILNVAVEELNGRSFYECIDERCLSEAIRCLEGAKANDSIAYLRFFFRDPRETEDSEDLGDLGNVDQLDEEASHSTDSDDGGIPFSSPKAEGGDILVQGMVQNENGTNQKGPDSWPTQKTSNTGFGGSTGFENDFGNAMFDNQPSSNSTSSSYSATSSNSSASSAPPLSGPEDTNNDHMARRSSSRPPLPPMEVEAVVSCTSDGLVVIIRAARIAPPGFAPAYANGLFTAPWAAQPIMPQDYPDPIHNPGGLPVDDFMSSIHDVAVFAWALTGINGNIASYCHGISRGEATPPNGFPIWDPQQKDIDELSPENQAAQKWERHRIASALVARRMPPQQPRIDPFGNQEGGNQNSGSSIGVTSPIPSTHLSNHSDRSEHGPASATMPAIQAVDDIIED